MQKPVKRATVDTISPTEDVPSVGELATPTSDKQPKESGEVSPTDGLNKNKSSDSMCSVNSNES